MNGHELYAGERYRHYKGGLYQIVTVAMHTETDENMVVYQALYGDYKVFARPLKMFLETVKDEAGNVVPRFVREDKGLEKISSISDRGENSEESEKTEKKENSVVQGINPLLITFLDAESSVEKLEILHRMRKSIDNKTISDMAAALDIVIEEKDMDERIKELEICLQTRARFETTRLR